jgi:hypothetical protein
MPLGLAAGINTNRIDVVSLPHEELVCADEWREVRAELYGGKVGPEGHGEIEIRLKSKRDPSLRSG